MILSNSDIKELMEDKDQPTLVRYLATRIVNMHVKMARLNSRLNLLAGAMTHIGTVARDRLAKDTKQWQEGLAEDVRTSEVDDED